VREFVTAATQADPTPEEQAEGIPFTIVEQRPGERDRKVQCRAHKPTPAQFAIFIAETGRHTSDMTKMAAFINFFMGVLDEHSVSYIKDRLLDPTDPFDVEQIEEITEMLVEEWTGNPTQEPSGSTPSQPSTGLASTPPTPALT
jgi:hypothetical protein